MTRWSFEHIQSDPDGCCQQLVSSGAVSFVTVVLIQDAPGVTTLEGRFVPPPGFEGFPEEVVRISILWDQTIVAVPVTSGERTWHHRYPALHGDALRAALTVSNPVWLLIFGALCLEFPGDPRRLRWDWTQGIDTYFQMVQRHLLAEEFNRRFGDWPVEDTPHGHREDGKPHPIMSPLLKSA